jgi:serine/threonine protein kinase
LIDVFLDAPVENTKVGPFLIIKKLGTNRRQRVYHARQTEQQRDVALKFIAIPPDVEWAKALVKIDLEVKELQKLDHPNLVKVYGAGVHEERIFFASELIDGESLSSILSRRGKITPDLVVEYGRQIADLLRYLHHHELIHSKLTPDKLLITSDHKVKIADLRLNRSRRRRWDSRRHRELDIAAYMAPEQFTEGATAKSDFYSLGVILFEMLTGKLPYEPDTMGRMTKMKMNAPVPSAAASVMNCPIWLDKIITQMLQPNPRRRPHSARAIVLAFEEIKKIDASKTAVVDQMTSSFNALNAGQDKSEARKLLGKKAPREEESEVSFFQSVPFMVASLIAILALVVFMAIPPSTAKRMQKAEILMQSDNANQWGDATVTFKQVMDGGGPMAEKAEELYYQSRRKSLVRQAERGISNHLQTENVQSFGKAFRLQQDGRDDEAIAIFQQLADSILAQRRVGAGSLQPIKFRCTRNGCRT